MTTQPMLLQMNDRIDQKTRAKIFLADERGYDETDWYRTYSTFNFGTYYNEHKSSFGDLYMLNDNTLASGCCLDLTVEESAVMLLIPVAGAVSYSDVYGNENIINAGQLQVSYLNENIALKASNPYDKELVNFLQVFVKAKTHGKINTHLLCNFDLNERNQLIEINKAQTAKEDNPETFPRVSMGKFAGREEALYKLNNKQNRLFIYVIQGVFEVQGRLLHARDSLGLWNINEDIELEALSNDAILLMMEFG